MIVASGAIVREISSGNGLDERELQSPAGPAEYRVLAPMYSIDMQMTRQTRRLVELLIPTTLRSLIAATDRRIGPSLHETIYSGRAGRHLAPPLSRG